MALDTAPLAAVSTTGAWHAGVSSAPAGGLFSASARYDLAHGAVATAPLPQSRPDPLAEPRADPPGTDTWSGTLAQQRATQELSARVPIEISKAPLQFKLSTAQQLAFASTGAGSTGLFATSSRSARARWAPGYVSFDLDPARGIALGTQRSLALGPWSLHGQVAWQPTDRDLARSWTSGASVSRAFWNTPLTASWQRTQPEAWTFGAGIAGQQTAVALDLAPPLKNLAGPRVGGALAWRFLQPDDRALTDDQSVMLNLSFGW